MRLLSGKRTIASRVEIAASFISRAAGLLGRSEVPPGYAMLFPGCNGIHTFFMKIPVDVIMYDSIGSVVFAGTVAPWRAVVRLKARDAVEMRAGSVRRAGIAIGDTIKVKGKSQKL